MCPPLYPEVTAVTPFMSRNIASVHQKHPAPNVALSKGATLSSLIILSLLLIPKILIAAMSTIAMDKIIYFMTIQLKQHYAFKVHLLFVRLPNE